MTDTYVFYPKAHAYQRKFLTVVSMDDVASAMHNTLGKKGMSDVDSSKLAEYLINFFGYADQVIDNLLTSADRDVFYMLEEEGFLTTYQEEAHLTKGVLWRVHYWILKKDQILRMAKREETALLNKDENSAVYDEVSVEMWNSHKLE